MLENISRVPCFDAFLRNIIVKHADSKPFRLVFCDFDKANRYNPVGEQLTHIILDDKLGLYYDFIVDTYVRLSGYPYEVIERVLSLTIFLRALAGVRDSLRWIPEGVYSIAVAQNVLERTYVSAWNIEKARKHLREFRRNIGKQWEESPDIEETLDVLAKMTEICHRQARQVIEIGR